MEDKIIEVFKKYSKSVDTEYNVYNCLIEEDWQNIAREVVNKIVAKPVLCGDSEQFICPNCKKHTDEWLDGICEDCTLKGFTESK
jgi:hypothetical protein